MSEGEICARHYANQQPVIVRWKDGQLVAVDHAPLDATTRYWIAPPLTDLQVNGYAGVDFQKNGINSDDLVRASLAMARDGAPAYLLTLITDNWESLTARLRHLKGLRDASPELRKHIAGWHVEGPFLSGEPGFRGAHNASVMIDPSLEKMMELKSIVGSDPLLLTLAPEREGSLEAIRFAVASGITVSLGHSNASADRIREAVSAGARGYTHLANGCTQQLDRHDNIVWRVLDAPDIVPSLIPDGIHVSPQLFRLVHKVLPPGRIYYTTDAMSAAGAPPGRYSIGKVEVEVGADQIVRQPGQTNFAGSALRPIQAIERAARMLDRHWGSVWDHYAIVPRKLMRLPFQRLNPKDFILRDPNVPVPADFCLIDERQDGLQVTAFVDGKRISA